MTLLDEITAKIGAMSGEEKAGLATAVAPLAKKMRFVPLPGNQTDAYLSDADVLLYAGEAGGGKTGLLVGLAQEHVRSILFRRESSQTDGLEEFGKEVYGSQGFNGTEKEWSRPNWSLKLAGMKEPGDWMKNAGRERDLIGFDEAGEFLRIQVGAMFAWNRGPLGRRARIVLASNPPRTSDGYWMTEWFAPWLDIHYPNRAEPGELRWAVMLNGPSGHYPHWVDGPGDVEIDGEMRKPLSFTYIPSELAHNPYRDTPEYRAKIDSLPEPLRSQLKYGDFSAGVQDGLTQAIPTDWVKQAMNRWQPRPRIGVPMCAMGVDVAQGGTDQTVIAERYDEWFPPLSAVPGTETPGGADVAGRVLARRQDGATVVVDLGGGWGGDVVAHLVSNIGRERVVGYMGVKVSSRRTRDNQLRFTNVRTEAYWRLREALDPTQPGGSSIQLPMDKELLADLTAPTFSTKSEKGGMAIQLEAKEALVKRLGRSPDKGDAVVMAWYAGEKSIHDIEAAQRRTGQPGGRVPQVIMGKGPRLTAGRRR